MMLSLEAIARKLHGKGLPIHGAEAISLLAAFMPVR